MNRITLTFCLILLAGVTAAAFSQIAQVHKTVLIVNPENPLAEIKRADAANFFLAKQTQWPSKVKVLPVDQKKSIKDSKAKAAFLDKLLQMKERAYKAYWMEKMLSGEAEPPKSLDTDEKIVDFVQANPGAIAYVSAEALTKPGAKDKVKVLPVLGLKGQEKVKVTEW